MKIAYVACARPNFVKISPLLEETKKHDNIASLFVHTGQHYDQQMSGSFLRDLQTPEPDVNLGVGSGNRAYQVQETKRRFGRIIQEHRPDLIVVVGDVNGTLGAALAAKKEGVAVAHVEAGLRSFDRTMPEELNRKETDSISDYLFVTEKSGLENLESEGVSGTTYFVGNIMIDSLVRNRKRIGESTILEKLDLTHGDPYCLSTLHRPSNVDTPGRLTKTMEILDWTQRQIKTVLPIHPRTRKNILRFGMEPKLESLGGLVVSEPLGPIDFLRLAEGSKFVLTDSGGIQEEATYLRVPCITLRENTERPITIDMGSNTLVGTDIKQVQAAVSSCLNGSYKQGRIPPLWDGKTAQRIMEILSKV